MPEGLEAELYRRAGERAVGRPVAEVLIDERQPFCREIRTSLVGTSFSSVRRVGKVVLFDLAQPAPADTLGLHFGMTGRLVVDGEAPIEELEYSSGRDDPAWNRLVVTFDDRGTLRVNDPRRWARFVLDPALDRLGPDFLDVTADHLALVFARRRIPVKAALLDQAVVAGYGNMSIDEVLWQTGISPMVPARELPHTAIERLVAFARPHLVAMLDRGGSHRGTIDPEMRSGLPPCPRDGTPLRRDQVGGRTTIWCPTHQVDSPAG